MKRFFFMMLIPALLGTSAFGAGNVPLTEEQCNALAKPSKGPAPVDGATMLAALKELRTAQGVLALTWSEALEKEALRTFDAALVQTKMDQFYRFLYLLQENLKPDLPKVTIMDIASTRKILSLTGVFDSPEVPDRIESVTINRTIPKDPKYVVRFTPAETRLPVNTGAGYYRFTHGYCQHTTALVFYPEFSFSLRKFENGDLIARYFKGVDFFGSFGTRGMFDIDFNYVSILAVKFFSGSTVGEVTATMSPQEFKKNEHNALLRLVTKFAKNSSTQPLGW